ncbi:MAG TPA: class I SAM-dependent methyltransferase [Vicinamibacterales bacterium]
MRAIDERAIKAHADQRFRSEYDYALFEYYRSAKVIAFLDRSGVRIAGRVLDAGCGGGGMPLSLAEEARQVVGIDPINRFGDAGVRLARERERGNLRFALADGMALPFATGVFDLVLSHAVIEHVADAPRYLRECARVLAPGGRVYLSTSPYLSFAGAHLPRLKLPVPLHLIVGRRLAFRAFVRLARHAPWLLREPANENSFIKLARLGQIKHDDLLEKVTVSRLRQQISAAGLAIVREELHVTATIRRLPRLLAQAVREDGILRDIFISNMEYVLARAGDPSRVPNPATPSQRGTTGSRPAGADGHA